MPGLIDKGGNVSMNLKLRQTAIACAGGAAVAMVLVVSGAQALNAPGTITVAGQQISHAHIDMGKPGSSVGDLDVYNSLIYNKRITPRSIGRGSMSCTAVSLSSQSCSATYSLPKGTVVVQGVIASRLIYQLAVAGGTGLYDNVRGSLTVTSLRRSRPVRELLVFRLVV
jgi:hypothetical protein